MYVYMCANVSVHDCVQIIRLGSNFASMLCAINSRTEWVFARGRTYNSFTGKLKRVFMHSGLWKLKSNY